MKILLSLGIGATMAITFLAIYGIGKAIGKAEEAKKSREKIKTIEEAYITNSVIDKIIIKGFCKED